MVTPPTISLFTDRLLTVTLSRRLHCLTVDGYTVDGYYEIVDGYPVDGYIFDRCTTTDGCIYGGFHCRAVSLSTVSLSTVIYIRIMRWLRWRQLRCCRCNANGCYLDGDTGCRPATLLNTDGYPIDCYTVDSCTTVCLRWLYFQRIHCRAAAHSTVTLLSTVTTIPSCLVESCLRYTAGGHSVGCYSIDGYRADGYTVGGPTADSGTPDRCIAGRYVVNRCTSTVALLLTVALSTVAPTPMVSLLTVSLLAFTQQQSTVTPIMETVALSTATTTDGYVKYGSTFHHRRWR